MATENNPITPSLSELVRAATDVVERYNFCTSVEAKERGFMAEAGNKLADALSRLSSVGVGEEDVEPLQPSASLEVKELLAASIAMRDDLIQRAKFDMPDAVPVVACGNSVWMKFQDAIHSYQASEAQRPSNPIPPLDDGAVETGHELVAFLAIWAVQYQRDGALNGLHPIHYDLLKKYGARMDSFTRATNATAALEAAESQT